MGLIDTHTHLESFVRAGTLDAVLARAREAGVEAMIAVGTSVSDWAAYRDIAASHPGFIYFTAGLHPCSVEANWEGVLAKLSGFWKGPHGKMNELERATGGSPVCLATDEMIDPAGGAPLPVALGECGLDRFHLPKDPQEAERIFARQRAAFAAQLALAKQLDCPVVVHSRGAFAESVAMIDASGVDWTKVVFHCFAEDAVEMGELNRRGGRGSFTGILTYKNAANVRAAAKAQGVARLMVETDAPYLTPLPHRGKPNEPGFVRHTAEFAAREVFGVSDAELAATTTANARRFFGL
jgi:TatD DNase family protein